MIHAIAGTYHWSEAEIMALPWRRLIWYLHVIAKANGKPGIVELEPVPELAELRAALLEEYGKHGQRA